MRIYLITNRVTGKIYVGQTRNDLGYYFYQQGWRARNGVDKKPALYSAIQKHGIENFSVYSLRECKNVEEMNIWEKFYIALLNSQNKEVGYNIASGGDGFPDKILPWNKGKKNPYTEEIIQRMSTSQKIRMTRDGSPLKGKKYSVEHNRQMSDLFKKIGIKPSVESCILGGKSRKNLSIAPHVRWHVNRGVVSPSCKHCAVSI